MPPPADPDSPFHVVFVCTGNRARSPLAEVLFRKWTPGANVLVESYGTLDAGPVPAEPDAVAVAAARGADLERHRSRSLNGVDLSEADLVVGFEPFHVSAAVVEAGAARDHTFTIRELAALLDESAADASGEGPERARAVVARAAAARGDDSERLSALSLDDPFGRPRRVYEVVGREIDELTSKLAAALFTPSG